MQYKHSSCLNIKNMAESRPSWCFKSYLQQVKFTAIFCVIGYPFGAFIFAWLYVKFTKSLYAQTRDFQIIRIAMLVIAVYFALYTCPFVLLLIGSVKKIKWMLQLNIVFLALAILFWIGFMIGFFGFGIHFDVGPLIGCIFAGLVGVSIAFGAIRDVYKAIKEIEREKRTYEFQPAQ